MACIQCDKYYNIYVRFDVPKIGKSSSTFYNQNITPDRFPIFQAQSNIFWRTSIFQTQAKLRFSTSLRSTLQLRSFVRSATTALIHYCYLGIVIFSPTTEIIPNNRNGLRSCTNTALGYFTNVRNTQVSEWLLLAGWCWWQMSKQGIISNFMILKIFITF